MNIKKIITGALVLTVLGGGAAFAASAQTPAEILADLTGKTVEAVYQEREEGETFGAMAAETENFEAFKTSMLENRKTVLQERVEEGRITQEEADEIYANMVENSEDCDGTGSNMRLGQENGLGFGQGNGNGDGNGQRNGNSEGGGSGNGYGAKNGNK
ncbi:DUF2680 domain-containing protein [Alkalibacter mobilis]|uniref:DUF2680 domain-containing protein n=1 Tax=Alkalibacter mobilis TaxID=2787712 RepID=UPI0018A02EC9|nr:DUF2680 domain-containing protein [Alkalibacter mobilis]MBF7096193.1 DUF2680 domain-containing protein [Alkalibacter mobilis]